MVLNFGCFLDVLFTWGRRYSRNRSGIGDSRVSGIGIGIVSCPSLGIGVSIGIETMGFSIVSESSLVSSTKQSMFAPNGIRYRYIFALALLENLLVNQMGTTIPWVLQLF